MDLSIHKISRLQHFIFTIATFSFAWEQRRVRELVKITMGQSPDDNIYLDEPSNYTLDNCFLITTSGNKVLVWVVTFISNKTLPATSNQINKITFL